MWRRRLEIYLEISQYHLSVHVGRHCGQRRPRRCSDPRTWSCCRRGRGRVGARGSWRRRAPLGCRGGPGLPRLAAPRRTGGGRRAGGRGRGGQRCLSRWPGEEEAAPLPPCPHSACRTFCLSLRSQRGALRPARDHAPVKRWRSGGKGAGLRLSGRPR